MHSVIGWPAPEQAEHRQGARLGPRRRRGRRDQELLGLDPTANFDVPADGARARPHARRPRPRSARGWQSDLRRLGRRATPSAPPCFDRLSTAPAARRLGSRALPVFEPSEKGIATRAACGEVLTALKDVLPELWGGSADLARATTRRMKGAVASCPTTAQPRTPNPYGRTLHFGIREHAHGRDPQRHRPARRHPPYGGTFLIFSDYMRGAVRLAAIMKLPVTYVWTHDSIGLGEDGPTHQPIEHLAALRAMPGPRRRPARPTPTRPRSRGARSSSTPTARHGPVASR